MIFSSEEERRSLIPALFAMVDWIEAPVLRHARRLLATGTCPAIIRLAKPRGLGVFLGAEPAIRFCHRGVTPARLQVIDTDVTCQARAPGEFCLDAAAGRHRRFVRKQGLSQLAVLVASAGPDPPSARLFVIAGIPAGRQSSRARGRSACPLRSPRPPQTGPWRRARNSAQNPDAPATGSDWWFR